MRRALPLVALVGFLAASPAAEAAAVLAPNPGVTRVFVAYGTGVSRCDVTLKKRTGQDLVTSAYGTSYSGRRQCTARWSRPRTPRWPPTARCRRSTADCAPG